MRVVIFTGNPDIESTPWWPILIARPEVSHVLICRKASSMRTGDVLRRLRRNVRKHGFIFIPYRIGVLALDLVAGMITRRDGTPELEAPRARSVPCERIESLDFTSQETLAQVRAWTPDLGISLGAPILKPSIFRLPKLGTINLHLGKVPDFRGAPPGFWELYHEAREIGATVHWVEEGLDTGWVIEHAEAPIYPRDDLSTVEARAEELGKIVLSRALGRVAGGDAEGAPQSQGGHTFRFPTLRQRASLALRLAGRGLQQRAHPRYMVKRAAGLILMVFRPIRDLLRTLLGRHPVRVFTYHRVTSLCRDGMTVAPSVFRRQVRYIAKHHDVMDLEPALDLLRRGRRLRRPVAVITFDDGYRSVFDAARPILTAQGLRGCCFVSTDLVGTDSRFPHDEDNPVREHLPVMAWGELDTLKGLGWSVGGHTATHARLSECDDGRLDYELARPLDALRENLGLQDVSLAYPFGGPNDITPRGVERARDVGYRACLSDYGGENVGEEHFEYRRIDIGGDHRTFGWKLYAHGLDLGRWRGRRVAQSAATAREPEAAAIIDSKG